MSDDVSDASSSSYVAAPTNSITTAPASAGNNTKAGPRNRKNNATTTQAPGTTALSRQFLSSLSGLCCQACGRDSTNVLSLDQEFKDDDNFKGNAVIVPSELYNLQSLNGGNSNSNEYRQPSAVSPLVTAPMMNNGGNPRVIESLISDYVAACRVYGCADRINAGILTTLRFSLPSLRVSGSFHDADMVALAEVLLKHINGPLSYIQRLDFGVASKEGRLRSSSNKFGFTSHGALALAKTLQISKNVREVFLPRHRIGPYGASGIFMACAFNPTIHTLGLRRCRIGERGAMAFAELICTSRNCGLRDVDLSANTIGHRGSIAIERGLAKRQLTNPVPMNVNLEGNLVFPEIMNGCTHGLGVLLSMIGGALLSKRVEGISRTHEICCAIYTSSLIVLYLSSTLYHSFFSLQNTKYVFEVFDKCAIYILIAGSYTPFLQILLGDNPLWSVYLLAFIWICCFLGICVEAFYPAWRYRSQFSLLMYLGLGWSAVACMPEMSTRIPQGCVNLLILGGVGYTVGVPFFIRNNNLDHAIWHIFVLSGSIFHWFGVYIYVAPMPLPV